MKIVLETTSWLPVAVGCVVITQFITVVFLWTKVTTLEEKSKVAPQVFMGTTYLCVNKTTLISREEADYTLCGDDESHFSVQRYLK